MGQLLATYDYTDEKAEIRYQVLRYEPKDFKQRRPDGNGGWRWDLGDVSPLPYNLHNLAANPAAPVIIVEGEKDADNLGKLRLLATCNSGGAGKWQPHFGYWLKGRRVAIIPDNDEPGHRHAFLVAGSAMCYGAESVRIVQLDAGEFGNGHDVSDWLAKPGNDRTLLANIIRGTPEWKVCSADAQRRAA